MVTDPQVSKFLYEKASTKDKTLKLYDGSYHSILEGEPDDRISTAINDIISWLDSHCLMPFLYGTLQCFKFWHGRQRLISEQFFGACYLNDVNWLCIFFVNCEHGSVYIVKFRMPRSKLGFNFIFLRSIWHLVHEFYCSYIFTKRFTLGELCHFRNRPRILFP